MIWIQTTQIKASIANGKFSASKVIAPQLKLMITKTLYLLENSLPCYLRKVVVLMFKVVLHDIVKTVNLTTQLAAWTALRDTIQCKKGLWETWNAWNSVQMVSPRTWTLMGRWFAKIHSQVRVIKLLLSCRLVVCPWGLAKRGCTSYSPKTLEKSSVVLVQLSIFWFPNCRYQYKKKEEEYLDEEEGSTWANVTWCFSYRRSVCARNHMIFISSILLLTYLTFWYSKL